MEFTLQQINTDCEGGVIDKKYNVSKDFIEKSETLSNMIGDTESSEEDSLLIPLVIVTLRHFQY